MIALAKCSVGSNILKELVSNLLSELSNVGSLSHVLSKEVTGADVSETEVANDPVGDGALA